MAAVDDIKSSLDMTQIASMLGVDPQTADAAVDEALASLVRGMDDNASDSDGAVNLTRALGNHLGGSGYGDAIDIDAVDTDDGAKIVDHVLSPTQIQSLSSGASGGLISKLLPLLAPLVMGYLASKFQSYMNQKMGTGAQQAPPQPTGQTGGGLGDLLGDLLGGATQGSGGAAGGGGLADILGDLLGGGSAPEQSVPQTTSTSGGTGQFRVPDAAPDTEMRMDDSTAAGTSTQRTAQQQAPTGDVLGGLLKDILFGRS